MRPYISGPIAGSPAISREEKLNRFARAELVLRQAGHDPVNPLTVEACASRDCDPHMRKMLDSHNPAEQALAYHPDGAFRHTWACWLKYDLIEMLAKADSIAVLPEWETSEGAKLEVHIARGLNWPLMDLTHNAVVQGVPHQIADVS